MKVALIGSSIKSEEFLKLISSVDHEVVRLENTKNIHTKHFDVVVDLNFDDNYSNSISDYLLIPQTTLLVLSSVKIQLDAVLPLELHNNSIGFNALSTFINRSSIEFCSLSKSDFIPLLVQLGWKDCLKVESRLGLVSPRVVLMIINEAYFTLQEGTANREDIDKGLKLGTAYPFGAFEWSELIGIQDVYEVLEALYNDTHDDRYKICSLLKTEYLQSKFN